MGHSLHYTSNECVRFAHIYPCEYSYTHTFFTIEYVAYAHLFGRVVCLAAPRFLNSACFVCMVDYDNYFY